MIIHKVKLTFIIFFLLAKNTISGQNQAPRFDPPLQSNYFFAEHNATKPGDLLFWLNATDTDDTDLEFGIDGSLTNKLLSIKKINGKSAIVMAKEKFDREVKEKYENIVFYVKDKPGNKVYQSVRFIILDIDDNAPIFKNTPYKIAVLENQTVDTIIFDRIEAFDADGPIYNKFYFTLDENEYFYLDKTSHVRSGVYSTNLILRKNLDYEKNTNYVLKLNAIGENSVLGTTIEILVTVKDVPNRKPIFSQSPYYVRMEEEMDTGDSVLKVFARDGDSGINNPCKYQIIESEFSNLFRINSQTGLVTIKNRIDLESIDLIKSGGLIEIEIKAVEIGDESSFEIAKATVSVLDVNDNAPIFNKKAYNFKISPKSIEGTPLVLSENDIETIHVYDPDKGINGSFSLNLVQVLDKDDDFKTELRDGADFEVSPKIALNDANLIIKLKNSTNLLKKIGKIEHLKLVASDNGVNGKKSKVDIFIQIENINEHAPQFGKSVFTFHVDENSSFNTTVGLVQAYDQDTFGDFGKIAYELLNGQERFEIDKESGRVYTTGKNPSVELDREAIDTFYMNVEAIDGGGLRTSVQVIIKLNDVNDNAPEFVNSLKSKINETNFLVGWIEENSATWLESVKVQAFDRDIGKNGAVTYEIIEGDCFKEYFKISNQSQAIELKSNLSLDFEQIYQYKQKNNLQLKSFDNQTLNFVLNPGEIDINLIVEARDQGIPSLSSRILDINDNRPKFNQPFYTVQILETAQFGQVIQVHAFDLDAPNTVNSKVIYSIESGNKEKFSIESTSGIITINENANLDRDISGSVYKLKISAQDFESINSKIKINKSDENYCYVLIEIIDVNNKKPKFTNNLETISIGENAPLGSHLYQMEAYDSDSNSELRFYLTEGESGTKMASFDEKGNLVNSKVFYDWIDIDPINGSLFVTGKIDREQVELIHLVVGVEDLNASEGFRPQKTLTKLIINVIDENDNYPLFPELRLTNPGLDHGEDPVFELFESIDENSKINSKITQLKVLDLDKDNNITFKIVSMIDPNGAIMVNKYTGEMFVNNLIDFEKNKWINLSILVNDNGKPVPKHSIVNFYGRINDLNDNPPTFIPLEKSEIKINENNDENYFIAQLNATDLDSDLHGPINYKILNFKDKFYIEPIDGKLYTKVSLDREKQSFYNLVIEARDNPHGPISNQLTDTMQIKIVVIDVNDNSPKCDQDMYSVEVGQNAEANTVLYHVKGIDDDYGLNSNLSYSLISQNTIDSMNELFEIGKFSGKIKTKKKLIGYSGKLSYQVVINDKLGADDSLFGNCPIQIFIRDVNIHYPQFIFPNKNNSNFRIKATLVPDSKILTIKAEDKDTGINGEIFYYIDQSNSKNLDWKNFKIDSKSGILSLKMPLNLKDQYIYSIDVIVSDNGQPNALKSRLTLTFILVDDSDNSARFNFKKICQLPEFNCDKYQRNIDTKIKEEKDPDETSIILNHAFKADVTNSISGVCYFVLGPDKDFFDIGLNGTLKPKIKLDRETRSVYNLIIKSTEHCDCLLKAEDYRCKFWQKIDISDDPSLLSLKIQVDDLNDNLPIFEKEFYQVGITYDIDFGDIILESSATDKDLNENLIFSIDNTSIITNSNEEAFPFLIEFSDTRLNQDLYEAKFLVKLAKNFVPRAQNFEKNIYYQFNLSVFDQSGQNSSATIQIIMINKQQRVKLVFSRSINEIEATQTEFKEYISNLTGLRAFIDSVQVHRKGNTSSHLSEILMHFVEPKSRMLRLDPSFRSINPEYIVVDSDTILNILDRSKDINLLKKYKLSLAEKYDNQGQSIFYRYSSRSEQDFGTFFLLSKVSNQTLYTKLIILASFFLLLLCSVVFIIMCFCIRLKYKRKLRAERAMTKAFGFEQRSIAYSDPIGGYLNHAFDSNSLLPIPGTNLYAYEGSNPVWMNKYDKIGCSNNQSSAASSSSSTSSDTSRVTSFGNSQYGSKDVNFDENAKNQDISSFYLKQIDSPSTDFSPVSTSNNSDKNAAKNETMSSDVFSNMSPNYDPLKETQTLSSFKVENNLLTFAGGQKSDLNPKPEVFSFKEQIRLLSSQRNKFSNGDETNTAAKNERVLYPNSVSSFTKIFDNSQSNSDQNNKTDDSIDAKNQSKDLSDMFAVESTVI